MRKVFLSGAIEGISHKDAYSWRARASAMLSDYGFKTVSPDLELTDKSATVNEIVRRNIYLQSTCDLVLAEYTIPNRCYIGTDFELCRAYDDGQPTIIWAHEDLKDRVYLQYLATVIRPTLEECVSYITTFY